MRRRRSCTLLSAVLALATFPAAAQGCGDAETPCEIDGGHYHAALPADGAARGAVLFLHGWGGTGRGVIRNGGLVSGFLERGYALIAPQGMPRREGDTGGSWNSFARESRRDDVAFLDSVAADAVARFGLDRDNMAVTGFSGGGMMAWRVACDAPATFRAYGPIAGLLWRPLPESCAGPIRMQHTHGWADPVVPIEGRSVAGGRFTQGDLFRGLDILRAASGCVKDDPDSYDAAEPYLIRRWTSCAEGGEIEMALHPGGHSIPPGWSTLFLDWYEAGAVSAGGL